MEFVHVCGLSGVGKRTLIHKLVMSAAIAGRFRIGQPIELFGPVHHPTTGVAAQAAEELLQATAEFNLHKWQFDAHNILPAVRDAFPSSTHRIVLIWRPFDQNRDSILERNAPEENPWRPSVAELESHWHGLIVPRFRDLHTLGFQVEIVDGSQPDYPTIPRPSVGF